MSFAHPKIIRRTILQMLYDHCRSDPHEMLGPHDFMDNEGMSKEDLAFNIHYLRDSGLVELMMGYNPPLFVAARITAHGIDLVENRYEFNRRFPPALDDPEHALAEVIRLADALVAEADLTPTGGNARLNLLRDVQYLREEMARPAELWRWRAIEAILDWIGEAFANEEDAPPSLAAIRRAIDEFKLSG